MEKEAKSSCRAEARKRWAEFNEIGKEETIEKDYDDMEEISLTWETSEGDFCVSSFKDSY